MMPAQVSCILALDVGNKRIGVAIADPQTRIASPLTTIAHDQSTAEKINELIRNHRAEALVIGLPRNLNGDSTEQTRIVEAFVVSLKRHLTIPTYWQDEALTSKLAEAELDSKRKSYNKGEVDSLAATYILEDFLRDPGKVQT
jgi:putative Holliday junction resolvase